MCASVYVQILPESQDFLSTLPPALLTPVSLIKKNKVRTVFLKLGGSFVFQTDAFFPLPLSALSFLPFLDRDENQ